MMAPHKKDQTTALRGVHLEHRHFAFIANEIRAWNDGMNGTMRDDLARHFADACRATNPRFNRDRFLAACGLGGEEA